MFSVESPGGAAGAAPRVELTPASRKYNGPAKGVLVSFKFERNRKARNGKDNDLHLEIAPSKNWNTRHVIGAPLVMEPNPE
jgi:hypothetical protein